MAKTIIPNGPAELPEAGHQREEALKTRIDELEEKAETLAAQLEVSKIDPATFEPDPEILRHYKSGDLPVSHADHWLVSGHPHRHLYQGL